MADTNREDRRALAARLINPLNRVYRYPAARALLRVAGGLPLRPNHVTAAHTAVGLAAAALVAFGDRRALVAAFFLLEARMILDCYDGVLARAKKLGSTRGRALDELGDATSYVALCVAMAAHVHRARPDASLVGLALLAAALLAAGALCGHAHDFYKRRLGSALEDGRDAIAEEVEQKEALVREGKATLVTRFGLWFDRWQVRLYEPRSYAHGDAVTTIVTRAPTRRARNLARTVGLLSWDNALGLLHVGLLASRVLEAELAVLGYGVVVFTACAVAARQALGGSAGATANGGDS